MSTGVHVWLIRADLTEPAVARLRALLDGVELRRAEEMRHPVDRRRFTAAHGVARLILAGYLGVEPGVLRWRRGRHGKPEVAGAWTGLHVNLSHSAGLAALAVSHGRRVGVDIQALASNLDGARLAARYFPPAEARYVAAGDEEDGQRGRFVTLWTRKEACVKAAGGRIMRSLGLSVRGGVARDTGGPLPGPFRVRDVPVPPGYRAAVALEGECPFRVRRRWWTGAASALLSPVDHDF